MGLLLARRLRDLIIILFLVGTAMFFIVHLIPGNPAVAMLGSYATDSQIHQLTHALGLDKPLWLQYVTWLGQLVHGNLGTSIEFQQSALPVILNHAIPTAILAVVTTAVSLLIAIPAALFAAARPRSLWARAVTPASVFGIAIPGFWLALLLVLVFSVELGWLPLSGWVAPSTDFGGFITHLILPVAVLVAGQAALFVRTLRESILGELLGLYLRTARAKGARENAVLVRHVLPNALLPLITVAATSLGTLLGGIVIIENIFVIPGVGNLLYQAIEARDYPLVEGITLLIALAYVVVNLLADLLYVAVDPRIRVR
jgi:peptide/nickel transport system permease protein